jgi:hypothetical protein
LRTPTIVSPLLISTEWLKYYVASKAEAKKIMQSLQFEDVVAKYWEVVRL